MAVAAKGIDLGRARRKVRRVLSLTLSGNYVTAGDTLDLTAITNPKGIDGMKNFSRLPDYYEVLNKPAAYGVQVIPGTTLANTKVKIWDNAAAAELAQAGYPGALTGADAIQIAFSLDQGV